MRNRLLLWGGLLALMACAAQPVRADGVINLRTQSDFIAALSGTNPLFTGLDPTNAKDPNTLAASKEYADFTSVTAGATLLTNTTYNFLPSLSLSNNSVGICAALYRYPTDPDLSDFFLRMQLYIPQVASSSNGNSGIDLFSFALIDFDKRVKFWQFDNTSLVSGNNTILIGFNDQLGPPPSYVDSNFDIVHVDYVQFSYHGTLTDSFPDNPDSTQGRTLWVGNQQLVSSTPEPGPMAALMIGTLGVAIQSALLLRRRKRAR